jgi:hypothetical protein
MILRSCAAMLLLISAYSRAAAPPTPIGPQNTPVDRSGFQVRFVSQTTGSDSTGDGSEAKPLASIQAALSKISDASADRRYAILVAAGTYRGATVEMKPFVNLYGGHDPKTWQRDIVAQPSILDGEQARRVVVGANDARIDGFVIRGAKIAGPGAGILCQRTSPIIANNTIVDNLAVEPADYVYGLFHQVGNEGGGIACITSANATITNNIIARNTTHIGGGGGIAARNLSLPIIENNIICDNRSGIKDNDPDQKKRARSSNGAGISLSHASSLYARARIANNVVSGNRVSGNSDAGGIYCEYDSSALIIGNTILNNLAEDDGGGIYIMKGSEPLVMDNVIAGNFSGGLRLSKEGRARIHNNIFFANHGGAMTLVDCWTLCTNNTIDGAGIGYSNKRYLHIVGSTFMNNIVCSAGKAGEIGIESNNPATISNNLASVSEGSGNFAADPQFIQDGAKGSLKGVSFDPQRTQTRLALASSNPQASSWAGRIVQVGDAWGAIASGSADELVIWGDLRGESGKPATEYTIAPTYRLSSSSPCIGKGTPIPKALWTVEPALPDATEGQAGNVGATPAGSNAVQASMTR